MSSAHTRHAPLAQPHIMSSDVGSEPLSSRRYGSALIAPSTLFVLAGLASGCSIEGVCIEQRERDVVCRGRVSRFECQGEWHEYVPVDGDLGMGSGMSTCLDRGFTVNSAGELTRRD